MHILIAFVYCYSGPASRQARAAGELWERIGAGARAAHVRPQCRHTQD